MSTKTANDAIFADALASVVAPKGKTAKARPEGGPKDAPARPRNAQRIADRRPATSPTPRPATPAKAARTTASKEHEATRKAAAEGRTQGTQTGTAASGRNGKVPCACQLAVDAATGKPIVAACGRDTWKTFAPGHDARLKGALIRHGLAGGKIRLGSDPTEYSVTDAAGAWGFREQVAHGLANPNTKLAKKARRAAKAETPAPKVVKAKVGRWVREGQIVDLGGGKTAFRYNTKDGVSKDTAKFTLV